MLRLTFIVLCVAVVAQVAQADIAPNPATKARSLAPKETTSVSMDRERVEVTLSENNGHVKATFWMRNTSKSPTTLEVGFPDQDHPFEKFGTCISNLKVTVDGVQQGYKPYDPTRQPDGRYVYKKGGDQRGWYLWQTTFEGGQKRTIVVEYDCRTHKHWMGSSEAWTTADERELDMFEGRIKESDAFKKKHPAGSRTRVKGGYYLRVKRDREFDYVLATGAGWHGPIGEAVIEVKLTDDAAKCVESLKPHGASWQKDTITWVFKDLEPTADHDISIRYRQGTYHKLGLKPGLNAVLAILQNNSHADWRAVAELATSIGTKECTEALRGKKTAGSSSVH